MKMKNMEFASLNLQRGAVLAFSLVMLLLLTLAGTRMIQQNKQQLEMAGSARLLTQEFANAEGLLEEAKNVINDNAAHVDRTNVPINNSAHQCEPTADFKQNILLAGTDLFPNAPLAGKVTILKVTCMGVPDPTTHIATPEVCSRFNGTQVSCKATTPCSSITDAIAASQAGDICYQHYDPWVEDSSSTAVITGKCPKEIYTIQVISTSANGTTRQIISDHVVGCGS